MNEFIGSMDITAGGCNLYYGDFHALKNINIEIPETLMSPGTSLALDIYYFASHGYPDEAAATAVVLLVFVMILNLLAGFIGNLIRKSTYGDAK